MAKLKLFLLLPLTIALGGLRQALSAGTGTCSETQECESGCCSDTGFCGFGPDYCGDSCISTCNRTAECGEYAAESGAKCPLNVCCSEFGFCGTTSDFCGDGCQSGCDEPEAPSCSSKSSSATKKRIGYYESWTMNRSCNVWKPSNIDATKWTHLNYAFALIDKSTFKIAQMNSFDVSLYREFTNLKTTSPSLEVFISVGGWDAGGEIWSKMTSTQANRAAFIESTIKFMKTYAFDGVDIDWEYPVAEDRGGDDADFDNFVTFLKELKEATGDNYGITVTLPSSYWYLQGFDIVNMEQYVDWFNIMSYDIHGTWDGKNKWTSAVVQAHTNLTEIDDALNLLWRNGISSSKVVLGLGFYGRSFTLSDKSCTKPGCSFSGGAKAGECTDTSGVLSLQEIKDIIDEHDLDPVLDEDAAVKYITWDDDQWVSFDDTETFAMKLKYANSKCLAGTMVWALDLDTVYRDNAIDSLLESDSGLSVKMRTTMSYENTFTLGIFWTACLPPTADEVCPYGYYAMLWGHGKVFDADLNHITGMGCHGGGVKGYQRALCVENSITASCQWGTGSNSKACNSKCHDGFITLTKNSHVSGQKKGCKSGKYAPVCCEYIRATSKSSSNTCYNDYSNGIFGGGLSQKLSLGNAQSYTYTSDDEDSLEVRDHNALKERQLQKRTDLAAKTKMKRSVWSDGGCGYLMARDDIGLQIPGYLETTKILGTVSYRITPTSVPTSTTSFMVTTSTVHSSTRVTEYETETRTCNGARYPQACAHYRSVSREYTTDSRFQNPTCADTDRSTSARPLVRVFSSQHNQKWEAFIAKSYVDPNNKRKDVSCQRDEWPPAHFMQSSRTGYIRMIPGGQNGGVANRKDGGWNKFCKYPPESTVVTQGGPVQLVGPNLYVVTIMTSTIVTLRVMEYSYTSLSTPAGDKDAIRTNPCWPSVLTNDPGYALFTHDSWYSSNLGHTSADYRSDPALSVTQGKSQPQYKRALDEDTGELVYVVDEGNSTRRATDEELAEHFELHKCGTPDCTEELKEWQSYLVEQGLATMSLTSEPTPPPVTTTPEPERTRGAPAEPLPVTESSQATETAAAESGELQLRRAHFRQHLHGHKHDN